MVQFMKMRGDICDDIKSEIVDYKEQLLKDGYYHDKFKNLKGVKHKNKSRLTDALIKMTI